MPFGAMDLPKNYVPFVRHTAVDVTGAATVPRRYRSRLSILRLGAAGLAPLAGNLSALGRVPALRHRARSIVMWRCCSLAWLARRVSNAAGARADVRARRQAARRSCCVGGYD